MHLDLKPKHYCSSMSHINGCHAVLNQHREFTANLSGRYKIIRLNCRRILTGLKLVAFGVAIIATLVFESIVKAFKQYNKHKHLSSQMSYDLNHLRDHREQISSSSSHSISNSTSNSPSDSEDLIEALRAKFNNFIRNEGLFKDIDEEKKDKYVERAVATYSSSKFNYGNVVIQWVLSIFETALTETPPKRVVFMARDGIAPYEVAKILAKRYPLAFESIPLSLLYLSRKVIKWSKKSDEHKQIMIEYAKQEGIKKDEKCLFIDIGFHGSMINTIKETFESITPQDNIEFGFLVSHTSKAHGFMGDMDTPLSSVRAAGQNPAVHWLEDTHQGVRNSASKLELELTTEKVVPYIKDKKGNETCKETKAKSYLYKHAGMMAILDAAKEKEIKQNITHHPHRWRMATKKAKESFDKFLMQFQKGQRRSFSKHF